MSKTTTPVRVAHVFFLKYFFAVTVRLPGENAYSTFYEAEDVVLVRNSTIFDTVSWTNQNERKVREFTF